MRGPWMMDGKKYRDIESRHKIGKELREPDPQS